MDQERVTTLAASVLLVAWGLQISCLEWAGSEALTPSTANASDSPSAPVTGVPRLPLEIEEDAPDSGPRAAEDLQPLASAVPAMASSGGLLVSSWHPSLSSDEHLFPTMDRGPPRGLLKA